MDEKSSCKDQFMMEYDHTQHLEVENAIFQFRPKVSLGVGLSQMNANHSSNPNVLEWLRKIE